MSLFNDVVKLADEGLRGNNKGLPMGFPRLSQFIPNIQRGTYYLVGADTGVGKTAFIDSAFMYNPYGYIQAGAKEKLKIIYYSFEIDKTIKIAKGICRKMFIDDGVVIDVNTLLSRGGRRISREHYELMLSKKPYFDGLEAILDIHDIPRQYPDISKHIEDVASKEENKGTYIIVIIDHAALLKKYQGETKANIDALSKELIYLRNRYKIIPVVSQQFNRDGSSTGRFKLDRLEPQMSDFKDSGETQADANIVIGLFSPARYQLPFFRDYDIKRLRDRYRFCSVMKNRDGEADLGTSLNFIGECGFFRELPKASEMTEEDYIKYSV